MTYSIVNMRLTKESAYWKAQMNNFAEHIISINKDIKSVSFGKQDIRGGFSITLFDSQHCVPRQEFFISKDEMLGYIRGYNMANSEYNVFKI